MNLDGNLHGAVITYVDSFNLAGTDEFVEKVISVVEEELMVSKVEENVFRFTALDVKVVTHGIKI